ncbi:hypothetical protein AA0616_2869 [Komagataeibacter nataicola NRIC 0616]|nr:hypothetical protein AA0616_2869 [Komagataeibacter nataicola NRIC 0616]
MACMTHETHSFPPGPDRHGIGPVTTHARRRGQQRAIRPATVGRLLKHGIRRPAGKGTEMVYLPRWCHEEMLADGECTPGERMNTLYAIVGRDDALITVGHRYRRRWR